MKELICKLIGHSVIACLVRIRDGDDGGQVTVVELYNHANFPSDRIEDTVVFSWMCSRCGEYKSKASEGTEGLIAVVKWHEHEEKLHDSGGRPSGNWQDTRR